MRIFTTNFGTVKEVDPGGIIATASQRRKKRERNDLLKKSTHHAVHIGKHMFRLFHIRVYYF